ncbi:MAG: hypothetical protein A2983_01495 [Candidatus Magasanikbacteria bacterium RIFCSPLOWO2_01_FULL_40_15]|uniref:Uncharacterized protein n=1 Tax=Candidatus Magasanikbacteria bacterium RIFCSPLOWO2_01_FULL_40_15 TaxID=1798686 RepID=A0A1F6N0W5_9BACT|nr:MAG: hypothetical protein A2983_01495 [Candidatus Magasanikbacteria bacterium RIFCSPLOWO2_01_FULL_40_15]
MYMAERRMIDFPPKEIAEIRFEDLERGFRDTDTPRQIGVIQLALADMIYEKYGKRHTEELSGSTDNTSTAEEIPVAQEASVEKLDPSPAGIVKTILGQLQNDKLYEITPEKLRLIADQLIKTITVDYPTSEETKQLWERFQVLLDRLYKMGARSNYRIDRALIARSPNPTEDGDGMEGFTTVVSGTNVGSLSEADRNLLCDEIDYFLKPDRRTIRSSDLQNLNAEYRRVWMQIAGTTAGGPQPEYIITRLGVAYKNGEGWSVLTSTEVIKAGG